MNVPIRVPPQRSWLKIFSGVVLLAHVAERFRIDLAGDYCPNWPTGLGALYYGALYAASAGLLFWGWTSVVAEATSLRRVVAAGAAIHLMVLLLCMPFASLDTLLYGVFGHAQVHFGRAPTSSPFELLPADDSFVRLLPNAWRSLPGSSYGFGFHLVARGVAHLAGDSVFWTLKLYQLIAMGSVLFGSWLVGRAIGGRRGAQAAALLLFCPISLIEATANGHNDALLFVVAALFVALVMVEQNRSAIVSAAAGFCIKGSSLLLFGLAGMRQVLRPVRRWIAWRSCLGLALAFAVCGLVVALVVEPALAWRAAAFIDGHSDRLIGRPWLAPLHCTRSIECIPRALLHWGAGQTQAAWAVGLLFRVAGALWLLYVLVKLIHCEGEEMLAWCGIGLVFYFLFLQGYFQSWYLLLALPFFPFLRGEMRRLAIAYCFSASVYYAIRLPLNCDHSVIGTAVKEMADIVVVVGIPTFVWMIGRWRSRKPRWTYPDLAGAGLSEEAERARQLIVG